MAERARRRAWYARPVRETTVEFPPFASYAFARFRAGEPGEGEFGILAGLDAIRQGLEIDVGTDTLGGGRG